jgi:hypothetical protein
MRSSIRVSQLRDSRSQSRRPGARFVELCELEADPSSVNPALGEDDERDPVSTWRG